MTGASDKLPVSEPIVRPALLANALAVFVFGLIDVLVGCWIIYCYAVSNYH